MMLVREMMSTAPVLLPERTTLREAARLLYEHRRDGAPVVDAAGVLTGMVTEIDLMRDQFEPDTRDYGRCVPAPPSEPPHRVAEVMSRAVITAAASDDAGELAHRMIETSIRCVPVLDGGRVVGAVERRDVMKAYLRPDEDVRADVATALDSRVPGSEHLSVSVADGAVEVRGTDDPVLCRRVVGAAASVPGARSVAVLPLRYASH